MKAKPKDVNMQLVGFRITSILTDDAQKPPRQCLGPLRLTPRNKYHSDHGVEGPQKAYFKPQIIHWQVQHVLQYERQKRPSVIKRASVHGKGMMLLSKKIDKFLFLFFLWGGLDTTLPLGKAQKAHFSYVCYNES